MSKKFYLGCAVWAYAGWLGEFYPPGTAQGDFLKSYVKRLGSVEGNTTFYAIPSDDMITRWVSQMPEGFKFCPKLFKGYTHDGALYPHTASLITLSARLARFGAVLGPIMLQLPPSYDPSYLDDLNEFLTTWPTELQLVVEVRHRDWWSPENAAKLGQVLEQHGVGQVLLDTRPVYDCPDDPQYLSERRKPQLPVTYDTTSDVVVVRYIGHPTLERNRVYLDAWAEYIAHWLSLGKTVYFFAHCPNEVCSPFIARGMHRILTRRGVAIGSLGWDSVKAYPKQLGLL